MTAQPLVTRRMLIKDLGKAGLAVVVLGSAACATDSGELLPATSAPTTTDGGSTPPTSAAGDTTTTLTTPASSGYRWHRVNVGVSAYVLYRGGVATIVDTGNPGSEGAIEAGLVEVGLGWGDVGAVVVTHFHGDHQGSLNGVLAATSPDLPWFAGAEDLARINATTDGTSVGDGDVVDGALEIISTPGHTPGHISVLDPVAGILVTGDALNGGPDGVAGPNDRFTTDMETAIQSVVKLSGFDYDVALFGHGEPVTADASAQVAALAGTLSGG